MLTARSRRMFATMTSLLVLLMTLAACGGGVKDTTIPAPPSGTKVDGAGDSTSSVGLVIGAMQPELEKQLAAKDVITDKQEAFTSSASLTEVVDFYKAEMKTRGWKTSAEGEQVTSENAVLAYESGDNGALIMVFDLGAFQEEGVLVMTANAHQK